VLQLLHYCWGLQTAEPRAANSHSQDVEVCQGWVTGLYPVTGLTHKAPSVEPVVTAPASCLLFLKAHCSLLLVIMTVIVFTVIMRAAGCVIRSRTLLYLGCTQCLLEACCCSSSS
jgi:hypothetical protein